MKTDSETVRRAARIQENLQAWLVLTHPFAPVPVIVTALTYEIARVVGQQMPPDVNVDKVLAGVMAIMKEQIEAHRAGRLPP